MANQPNYIKGGLNDMDIERDLEFARKCVMTSGADIVTKTRVDETLQAIARQTTSEEIQDAIEALMFGGWQSYKDGYPITLGDKIIDIVITALQAYQPKPISEEVKDAIEWTEEVLSNSEIWRDGDFGIPVAKSRKLETTRQLILSALQAYEPWVSVENRLPEIPDGRYGVTCNVMVDNCSSTKVMSLLYEKDKVRGKTVCRWKWYGKISPWNVTHWKPLPEPPKGETP